MSQKKLKKRPWKRKLWQSKHNGMRRNLHRAKAGH